MITFYCVAFSIFGSTCISLFSPSLAANCVTFVDYLLLPAIRKRICVPLTKSNRVNERECLLARFDCWWALINKLGADVLTHFTEVCLLFSNCLSVS